MKTCSHSNRRFVRQRGSAVIIVIVMVAVIGAIFMENSRSLADLQRNLRLIEQKQIQKFGVTSTNGLNRFGETNRLAGSYKTNSVTQPNPIKP